MCLGYSFEAHLFVSSNFWGIHFISIQSMSKAIKNKRFALGNSFRPLFFIEYKNLTRGLEVFHTHNRYYGSSNLTYLVYKVRHYDQIGLSHPIRFNISDKSDMEPIEIALEGREENRLEIN